MGVFMLRKTGGGVTWVLQATPTTSRLWGVYYFAEDRAFAVGSDGVAISTEDGGASWSLVDLGVTFTLRAVQFTSSTVGWIAGSGGTLLKTLDGGTTWQPIGHPASSQALVGLHFRSENEGIVVGVNTIIQTSNGGDSWISRFAASAVLLGVHMVSAEIGFTVSDRGLIRRTDTSGLVWPTVWNSSDFSGSSTQLYAIDFVSEDEGCAVGVNSGTFSQTILLHTRDAGLTWQFDSVDPSVPELRYRALDMIDAETGWAVASDRIPGFGGEAAIVRWGSVATSVEDVPEVPAEYLAEVNIYPNPFTSVQTLTFFLKRPATVSVEIFNPLGQRVQMVALEQLPPGRHSQTVEMSDIPSGPYLIRFEAGGEVMTRIAFHAR